MSESFLKGREGGREERKGEQNEGKEEREKFGRGSKGGPDGRVDEKRK